jgi:hypothetical protein
VKKNINVVKEPDPLGQLNPLEPLPGNIDGFTGAGFEGFAPPNVA